MKKLLSLILSLVMLLTTLATTTTFAAGTGSITINGSSTVSVNEKTFNAYKILDATLATDTTPATPAYSVPSEMKAFYTDYFDIDGTLGTAAYNRAVAEAIADLDASEMEAFAKAALAEAKKAHVTPVTATGAENKVEFSGIPYGYYVIEDTTNFTTIENDAVSAVMINTTTPNAEIQLKAEVPTLNKTVDDKKVNEASIGDGDTLSFKLTSAVPDMTGYDEYSFVVTDTMSKGITFKNDVAIKLGTTTLTKDTDYTVTTSPNAATGETIIEIEFKNFINHKDKKGQTIEITYTGTLNANAAIGTANKNTAYVEYSNNPNVDTSKGKTPNSETETYTTSLTVNKVDDSGNVLTGASFKLTDANNKTVGEGPVDENGHFTFTGLGAGKYTLTETVVPDGYNGIDPIEITISFNETTKEFQITTPASEIDNTNTFEIDIENKKGVVLPGTGGMGTTIFYIVGGLLMFVAAVLLITKKKMSANN